jgi:hypothetical protein
MLSRPEARVPIHMAADSAIGARGHNKRLGHCGRAACRPDCTTSAYGLNEASRSCPAARQADRVMLLFSFHRKLAAVLDVWT